MVLLALGRICLIKVTKGHQHTAGLGGAAGKALVEREIMIIDVLLDFWNPLEGPIFVV